MIPKRKILFRTLFGLYVALVLFLCFAHFESTPSVNLCLFGIPTDKLVHFCMFFPFPILAFLAFDRFTETPRASLIFVGAGFVAGCLLAAATEWGQAALTDYRSGDPWDLLADAVSLLLASLLVLYLDIRKQKR